MKQSLKAYILSIGAVLAASAAALPASAALRAPATSGTPLPASDAGCFSEFYGALTNVCPGEKLLRFSPALGGNSHQYVTVYALTSSASSRVKCQAISVDIEIWSAYGSPIEETSGFSQSAYPLMFAAWHPTDSSLYINCYLTNGARINWVIYH